LTEKFKVFSNTEITTEMAKEDCMIADVNRIGVPNGFNTAPITTNINEGGRGNTVWAGKKC